MKGTTTMITVAKAFRLFLYLMAAAQAAERTAAGACCGRKDRWPSCPANPAPTSRRSKHYRPTPGWSWVLPPAIRNGAGRAGDPGWQRCRWRRKCAQHSSTAKARARMHQTRRPLLGRNRQAKSGCYDPELNAIFIHSAGEPAIRRRDRASGRHAVLGGQP